MAYGSRRYASAAYGGYPTNFKNTIAHTNVDGIVYLSFDIDFSSDAIVGNQIGTIVAFNGMSINGVDNITENTTHDSYPVRLLNSYKIARRDGEKIVSVFFGKKEITINGYIQKTDQISFESAVDYFKKIMSKRQGDLLISYNGSIREYFATVEELQINRDSYNIDWAPFMVKFSAPDGRGYDLAPTVTTYPNITQIYPFIYTGSLFNAGTADAFPVITMVINSQVALSRIRFNRTDNLDIYGTDTQAGQFNNNDVVVIDCANYLVTVNGVPINFEGVFPTFPYDSVSFYILLNATSANISLSISYISAYL